ncbi:MAG TPA: copper resistance CopC family protein [Actinomycetes bacterium]|nr:copper resistance CopC family protein [Actinomycetes bacterium]
MPRLAAAVAAAVVLAVGVALVLTEGSQDRNHAAVTSTSPADGATLQQAPTEVGLAFTGPVDPNRSHIFVLDGSGTTSARPAGALRQTAPQSLSQPISVPATGLVTVTYHVTFTDGAAVAGSLRFTVGSNNGADQPAPVSGHNHGIDPVSAGLLLADGITVLAVLVLLLRRPRRSAPVVR